MQLTPQQGAVEVGNILESEKLNKSKTKKKYLIRHLISGRIIVITNEEVVKVEKVEQPRRNIFDRGSSNQKPILL